MATCLASLFIYLKVDKGEIESSSAMTKSWYLSYSECTQFHNPITHTCMLTHPSHSRKKKKSSLEHAWHVPLGTDGGLLIPTFPILWKNTTYHELVQLAMVSLGYGKLSGKSSASSPSTSITITSLASVQKALSSTTIPKPTWISPSACSGNHNVWKLQNLAVMIRPEED